MNEPKQNAKLNETRKTRNSSPSPLRCGQLVFIDRTVWNGNILDGDEIPEERKNEPVLFDHEEVLEVAGRPYWRWWFIDADGNIDFIQGCEPPKTAEELFGRRVLV